MTFDAYVAIVQAQEAERDARKWHAVEYRPGVWLVETGPAEDPTLIACDLEPVHAAIMVASVNYVAASPAILPLYPAVAMTHLTPVVGGDPRD